MGYFSASGMVKDFSSSSARLDFFWLGIAGRTRLGFRGSPDRSGKRE